MESNSSTDIAKSTSVLIAEDHQSVAKTYGMMLEMEGLDVSIANDGEECIQIFKTNRFDVVVLDYHLPSKNGIDIAKHIISENPDQRIVIATSFPREMIEEAALNLNRNVELLTKPFDLSDFADIVTGRKRADIIGGEACCFTGEGRRD